MSNDLKISSKYKSLFRKPKTRYTIVTGGRGSGKSFAVATALLTKLYDDANTILFTRYTMTSARDSIIPEFEEKIEMMGRADELIPKGANIVNKYTGGKMLFRGLHTSTGNQTARLKSLPNVKIWVLDEAEELVDEETFETIDLSIRKKGADIEIWLVLNPGTIHHWIYRKFFKGVPDGFNGVRGDVTYIHTTYLDNMANLDDSFLRKAELMKAGDIDKYINIYLGYWAKVSGGLIFRNWQKIKPEEWPKDLPCWYGVDWGYSNDPSAVARMAFDEAEKTLYIWEVCYRQEMRVPHIVHEIKEDAKSIGQDVLQMLIYCDPARPEHIAEMRLSDLNAMKADNRNKEGRVDYLKYFRVKYVGDNVQWEVERYAYKQMPNDKSRYTNVPEDGDDHLMDAINYGGVTHLRWLGVTNDLGEI